MNETVKNRDPEDETVKNRDPEDETVKNRGAVYETIKNWGPVDEIVKTDVQWTIPFKQISSWWYCLTRGPVDETV